MPLALRCSLTPSAARTVNPSAVRAWARENGLTVGDRGRLPAELVEQFLKANPKAGGTGKPKPAAKTTARAVAPGSKAPSAGRRSAAPTPGRTTAAATAPGPDRPVASTRADRSDAETPAGSVKEQADEVLRNEEQVELLQDLPAVLEELTTELDAVQKALKDVQAENAQLKQRLDRLESKRGLFTRK